MLQLVLALAALPPAALDQTPPQYAFPGREHRQKGAGDHVAIAAGDLDGDGLDDVVSTTANAWLKVWRGRWVGILESAGTIPSEAPAHALALGDLDADGDLDLAFAVGNKLFAALGDGGAGFAIPQPIGVLKGVVTVATADVNGDGRVDVCALSKSNGRIKVFLAAPAGGFLPPITTDVALAPTDFELGDFDGDGVLDLAVADAGASAVVIARGYGDGTFAILDAYPGTQGSPTSVALGDLDGDGHLDFATASTYAFVLQQRIGAGDGSFGELQTCGSGRDIALTDWDGDGKLDRIALTDGAHLLLGTGACGSTVARRLPVSSTCTSIAILDTNGDSRPDLAFGAASEIDEPTGVGDTFTSVGVVCGYGASGALNVVGVRRDPQLPPAEFDAAFDLDGDGFVDALGILQDKSGAVVRRGTGKLSLHAGEVVPIRGSVKSVAPADLDGDGDLDLVALSDAGVHTALSTGSSFLPSAQVLTLPSVAYMRVADLDDDGWDDVFFVTPSGAVSFLSRGNGSFAGPMLSPEVEFPAFAPLAIAPADLDGDSRPDLVVAGWRQGLWTYFGAGDGTFVPAGFVPAGPYWSQTAVGDLDGDGLDDVLVANSDQTCLCDQKTVVSLLSDGQGGLQVHGEYEVGRRIATLGLHDLDGDGALDLHAWLVQGVLSIARGDGAGGFGSARRHGANGPPIGAGFTLDLPPGYIELVDLVVRPVDDLGGSIDLEFALQF